MDEKVRQIRVLRTYNNLSDRTSGDDSPKSEKRNQNKFNSGETCSDATLRFCSLCCQLDVIFLLFFFFFFLLCRSANFFFIRELCLVRHSSERGDDVNVNVHEI